MNPSRTLVSVIVPVYQGADVLGLCLAGLLASDLPREQWELIVVDDGSTDDTARFAAAADHMLQISDGPRGPAHARNVGAAAATSPLLCFVDADVVVAPHTLRGLVALMDADPTRVAAFGAYDSRPAAHGTVSQYRNLLHHHTHATHAGEAETFWAGCGIVRREAFRAVGGFDAVRYPRPQIEDIELGYRLRDAGGAIRLDPTLTGTHLKRWTFGGMLRTDLLDRALPWTRLLLDRGTGLAHAPLNLNRRQKVLTTIAASVWIALVLAALLRSPMLAALGGAGIIALVLGNTELLRFFAARHGWWFAAQTVPLQLFHHTMAALGAAWALVSRPPETLPAQRWSAAALGVAVLLLGLHAWLAWTMRIPALTTGGDDASLLTLARALREGSYRELWTVGTPIHAMYPPGFPSLLALVGATDATGLSRAIALNIAASATALALAAVLAGRITPWLGVAALAVLAPNPALVDAAGRAMSEPVFTALLLATLVALATGPHASRRFALAGACAMAAALTRSIGVALIAAVVLDALLATRWRAAAALSVASALTVGAWFAWTLWAPETAPGSSYVADAVYVPSAEGVGSTPSAPTPRTFAELLLDRTSRNVPGYLTRALPVVLAQPSTPDTPVDNVLGLVVLLGFGAAGTAWLLRRQRAILLTLGCYALILAVWPYLVARFLVPVLPLIVLVLLVGAWRLGGRLGGVRWQAPSLAAATSVLALVTFAPTMARLREVAGCDRSAVATRTAGCVTERQRDFFAAVSALDSLAVPQPSGAESPVLLTAKPSTVFVLTGRRSVRQTAALEQSDPDAFLAWLRQEHVDLVLLSHVHIGQWGLSPMLRARCGDFEVLRTYPTHATVLRVRPADATRESGPADAPACTAIARWADIDWTRDVEQTRVGIW